MCHDLVWRRCIFLAFGGRGWSNRFVGRADGKRARDYDWGPPKVSWSPSAFSKYVKNGGERGLLL